MWTVGLPVQWLEKCCSRPRSLTGPKWGLCFGDWEVSANWLRLSGPTDLSLPRRPCLFVSESCGSSIKAIALELLCVRVIVG